ncbi:hypothetical protein LAZ67_17001567, partial [Cordylochernes scorpioides]
MATNLIRAESPSNAKQKPVRHGAKAQPCAELSEKEDFQKKTSNLYNKNQNYENPPAGGHHANPATPTDFVTASFSEAAAQANRSWADLAEDNKHESEDPFITVQRKKRRRDSAESPAAAAPSSGTRGAGATRRPRSSTGWAPRAEEVRTTQAHIAEARARQASSTEDHCVYVERSPELEPYHYIRAIDRMFGSTREVFQVTKMNGHFLVGLANKSMAERLVNEGLEVEGTLHRAFPFRKRAERITVGNLPFFVGDAAVISALSSFGRVTSIAPKLMKAGPYVYNDGRREAFIIFREGMNIERLPTRLDITIKGEAWPAYLSTGIRCSRCRGQGHRRANCPLLAGRTTEPGPATPSSTTSVPPATAPKLPQQPSAQPPPLASHSPAMEVSDVPPASRAALLPPAALRPSPPAPLASPAEAAPPAPPPVTPAPSLRTPGSREPAAPTPDIEMSNVEESPPPLSPPEPAAVPPTPPLPAPQPAGPIPPAPDEEEMTPIMREEYMVIDIFKKLKHSTCLRPLYQSGIEPDDIKDAILFIDERESLMARLTPAMRGVLAEFLSAAIEPARGNHPDSLNLSLEATNLVWADSPFNADELPARYGLIPQTSAELSANNNFQLQNSEETQEMASYANLPIGQRHANSASTRESATTLPSSGVFLGQQNRDNLPMDLNPVTEGDFTIVQNKRKRRDTTAPRDMTAQPNSAGSAARRQRSSPALIPRVQEIRTTRTHIAEARARQANCTEEQCFFLEYCPSYETYQYLRAIGGIIGGTKNIVQFSKVNGQYLVGLTSRSMAEQLIREGLEIEGTLLRTFPFRRSATRITIGNLPFFVRDAVVIDALARFGRVTSIAPKQLKAGEFEFTDGRREAFILLHDGITVEKLPTRFEIKIKGEAWPAYISYGIKCSRCHGQGHRRASCPLLYGQSTTSRRASPPSTTGLPPSTAPGLPRQSSAAPSAPAPPSPALGPSGAQPVAQAVSPPSAAPRPTAPAPPASSVHVAAPAPPPEAPTPEHPAGPRSATTEPTPPARPDFTAPCGPLPAQGTLGPATHTPDVDMTTTEEPSAPPPSAVSTPPLPTPQPARPTPPVPHGKESVPTKVASPPALPVKTDEDRKRWLLDTFKDLNYRAILRPIMVWSDDNTLINSVLCYEKAWNSYHNIDWYVNKISLNCQLSHTHTHTHTHTLGRAARICRAPPFSHPGGCMATGGTPSLARAESPLKADQMPGRHGLKAHLCAEKSAIFDSQSNYSNNQEAFDKYANLSAGGKDVNLAAPFNLAANPSSNAVAQAQRNWADMTEDINPEIEDNFTLVQRRKRRRGSGNSPTANAPSSNVGGSRTDRRPRSSTGWAPRAEEIRTTRAHIAEARAQQASSSEEYCVYIERSPDLEPFHYLRALDRMVGGTSGVVQVSKVNGLYLLGLTNRGLVERLISEGLEVEGTLLKAFPFRKRAERITVGNLPFFVADCVIINALSTFGRVTSIAPKLMKAGPYIYNDGRREAFIALHEGVTIERLPTRLEIKIKGETWPAYLTSGIRCSRCHGQGHLRAICPLLAGLANNTRMAPPTTPAGVPPPTTPAPPQRSAAQPPAPASSDPASETPGAPPEARAVTKSTAPRPSPPVAPAVSMEKAPSAPPPVTPAPSLQAPEGPVGPRPANSQHPEPPPARPDFVAPRGPLPAQKTLGPAAPTPDVEMSTTEEPSAPSPAAVSAPPLPAPQPAGPTPSAPHKEDPTPAKTPPSLPPTPMEEDLPPNLGDCIDEILREIIMSKINPGPLVDDETSWTDAIDAILHPHSRTPFLARLSPILKKNYAVFFEAAIERARDSHPRILS